jgi:flavin reductase (DIM6/NTAB) family NADH-FMN oxidoreductase RutF
MEFDPAALTASQRYRLLAGAILPRPIAVVSTMDAAGRTNVAPFSFFNGISASPMALAFSPVTRGDGGDKDTLRNALPLEQGGLGEFVVNLAGGSWARQMSATAEELPHGESELELAGLSAAPCRRVRPPRILEAAVSYECRTLQVVRLAPGVPLSGNLVIGEIVHVWVRDEIIDEALEIDLEGLDALGRLGGASYCRVTDRFDLVRGRPALSVPDPLSSRS